MDPVSAVTSRNSYDTSASKTSAPAVTADYNTFLKLLVTQLQTQDPLNPTDNTEFISQLASFSAVEQQTQTNDKLDQMLSYINAGQGASLIGKQLTSSDGTVTGVVASVKLTSDGIVATLDSGDQITVGEGVQITDPAG
jgi:flagellar basal-body rod modification protein FlgD